jgi:hypothetical protein
MSGRPQEPENEAGLSDDEIAAQKAEELPDREVMSVISINPGEPPIVLPGANGPVDLGPPPPETSD